MQNTPHGRPRTTREKPFSDLAFYPLASAPLHLIPVRAALGWTSQSQAWDLVCGSSIPEVMSKFFAIREGNPSRSWWRELGTPGVK